MSKKDTWCVYPFLHLATFTNGDVTPCCIAKPYKNINLNEMDIDEVWNHEEVKSLRQNMLDGKKVPNCEQCYKAEEHGIDSHRTSSNRTFFESFGISENDFVSSTVDISNLITFDLRLGNTCNLKCIMCRPNESHKWFDDIKKLNEEELTPTVKHDIRHKLEYNRDDYNWINKERFWNNIDEILPNIKEFIFGGGEPFMLKEVKHLLSRAVDLGVAKNISIRFHTNGTYLTEKDFKIFDKFKKVQLMFSVDGVDEINYFLRYPADWNKIITNIIESEKYDDTIETYLLCSLNGVSAYYLDQLYDFVSSNGWKKLKVENIVLGRVHFPTYLNPQILDSDRKDIVKRKFEKISTKYPECSETIESNKNWILGNSNESNINDMLVYLNSIFKIRNIDKKILDDFLNSK